MMLFLPVAVVMTIVALVGWILAVKHRAEEAIYRQMATICDDQFRKLIDIKVDLLQLVDRLDAKPPPTLILVEGRRYDTGKRIFIDPPKDFEVRDE